MGSDYWASDSLLIYQLHNKCLSNSRSGSFILSEIILNFKSEVSFHVAKIYSIKF